LTVLVKCPDDVHVNTEKHNEHLMTGIVRRPDNGYERNETFSEHLFIGLVEGNITVI
jgi:hypothetical protein